MILTALKPSDVIEGAIVVRVLECEGRSAQVALRIPYAVRCAEAVDLMERPQGALAMTDNTVQFTLRPHQFQTVRICLE